MNLNKIFNAKTAIWVGFLLLVYVLRHFFLIIFMTFLISYLMRNFILFLQNRLLRTNSRLVHKVLTVICFILLISGLYFGAKFTVPRLTEQGQALVRKIGSIEDAPQRNIDALLRSTVGQWLFEQNYGAPGSHNYNVALTEYMASGHLAKEYDDFNKKIHKLEPIVEKEYLRNKKNIGNRSENKLKFRQVKENDPEEYNKLLLAEFSRREPKLKETAIPLEHFNELLHAKDNLEQFSAIYKEKVLSKLPNETKAEILQNNFSYEESNRFVENWKQGNSAEKLGDALEKKIVGLIGSAGNYLASLIPIIITLPVQISLSLLLSFFITFDIKRLSAGAHRLRYSRIGHIYDEIVPGLIRFASLIGRAFQAQGVIALVNTFLTYLLMSFLNIENTLFLSAIVFICSFIPVLGVVLSGAPICAMAIVQDGGSFLLALSVIVGILVVHFIETSLLNPKIVGTFLHLHPVLVLVILAIGEHFFGAWGLLLGLPVAVYIIRIVILDEGLPWELKESKAEVSRIEE